MDTALHEGEINAEIARLALLPRSLYETERTAAAKQLGMRASVLDSLVKEQRADAEKDEADLPHWHVKPWSDQVDGAALLDAIERIFRAHSGALGSRTASGLRLIERRSPPA